MSVQIPEGGNQPQGQQQVTGQQTPQQNVPQNVPQNRAPYADHLEKIPEGLRGVVEPVFKEWDGNVTQRFQGLQEQLQGYEPYKELFDTYEPEGIQQAVQIAEQLSTREGAEALFQQLAGALGYEVGDDGNVDDGNASEGQFDLSKDPAFNELREMVGQLAGNFNNLTEGQQEAQLIQQAEQEFEALKAQHFGDQKMDPDAEEVILQIAVANGGDLEKAFTKYNSIVGRQATQQNAPGQTAPIVGGGANGTMPSNVPDMKNLTPQARKQLAVSVLQNANQT